MRLGVFRAGGVAQLETNRATVYQWMKTKADGLPDQRHPC